jgi:hypothetical protein
MPCDVFVSYSHADEEFPYGWVSTLHERLQAAVNRAAPTRRLTVWRDEFDIRKSERFTDAIKSALSEAKVLLCVLSPAYKASRFCTEELNYFMGRRGAVARGLVRVEKKRLEVSQQPEALQNILGHSFFEKRTGDELPARDDRGVPNPSFERLVSPLANEVLDLVQAGSAPRQCVLVLGPEDRKDERARLAEALEAQGVKIVPSIEDPIPDGRRDKFSWLEKKVAESDFAVLYVGEEPLVERAFDALGKKWPTAPRRCLLAMPAATPTDEKLGEFIERLDSAGEAFDYCDRPDQVLGETRRLLKALIVEQKRIPSLYLAYLKGSRARAELLREEIRRADALLRPAAAAAPWVELRFLDPYGDGDNPQMPTQTLTRDRTVQAAHGGLVLVENEGAFVMNALSDFDGGGAELRRHVVITPLTDRANVPDSLAQEYRFIQAQGVQRDWLPPGARVVELSAFLHELRERARKA